MLKIALTAIIIFSISLSFAQPNTEVFVFEINFTSENVAVINFQNISNNFGYDNQPSFVYNDFILYARTNEGQTDIYQYQIDNKQNTLLNKTTLGGEYSPQLIPNSYDVAAVRLDTTGLQRLYRYNEKTGDSKLLIENLQVAYYAFYNENLMLSSVLSGGNLDLVLTNLSEKTNDTILHNVGRSIHKIPNKNALSYTVINEEGNYDIYLYDMDDRESYFICQLPIGIQDHTWLDDSRLLLGSGSKIYLYDLFGKQEWKEIVDLTSYNIKNITRITTSQNGKKIAFAAETAEH